MRIGTFVLAAALCMAPLGATGRRPRGVVGGRVQPRGRRGGQGDHRRLRAGDRQAGRARPAIRRRSYPRPRSWPRSRPGNRPTSLFGIELPTSITAMGLRGPARRPHGRGRPLLGPVRSGRARAGATLLNADDRPGALYALPMGRTTNHVHVWKSLLEQAGFTLEDIPKEWEAFWSFWCDQVQPAVRRATGRDDIWGVGLPMSVEAGDTQIRVLSSSCDAYEADYVTRDGRLVIDDPEVRRRLDQGDRQLHGDLPQGLHPARCRSSWDGRRQQQGVPRADGRDDAERLALDPERAQARAARRLLQEHRDDRMAARRGRRAVSDRGRLLCCRGLQGRRARRHRQGVRPLPRGRGLARALSRLLRRAHAAADAEAARCSRSGSTRATRTAWPRRCRSRRGPCTTTTPWSRATGGTT